MNGHKLRILSSENDASVKVQQDQNTNITLKPEHTPSQADFGPNGPQKDYLKDSAPPGSPHYAPPGFTPGAPIPTPLAQEQYTAGAYPSVSAVPTVNHIQTGADAVRPSIEGQDYVRYPPFMGAVQTRDIDLTADIEDKDRQIEVLESLLSCYENNPLIINKFVVCQYETLMNIIKVLTNAEKVEFSLHEDKSCTCCNSKYIYISKIFVTKDGKTQEFKFAFNEKYSLLQRHGISLKICTR